MTNCFKLILSLLQLTTTLLLRRFLIFDTQTAIPVGTLAAVIVSGITYVMMVWSLASICEREGGRGGLFKDFAIMMPASADWIEESAVAPLIIAGTFQNLQSVDLSVLIQPSPY